MKKSALKKFAGGIGKVLFVVTLVLSAILFMACRWAKQTFNVSIDAIINTLTSPLQGTSSDTVIPAIKYCLPFVLLVFAIAILFIVLQQKNKKVNFTKLMWVLSIVSVLGSVGYVQSVYDVIGYMRFRNQETTLYEEYYIDPLEVTIHAPDSKRNLIYIYLESMETTYADIESGGNQEINYMPYCTQLAKENVSFSNTEKLGGLRVVSGATWTMGALFTSGSGLPFAFPVGANDMEGEELFASGVYSMGDYLFSQGYNQEFLCGSQAGFAGRQVFFEQHGEYKIFDLFTAREKGYIPEDYFKWWGYEDKILYEIAKDELLRLAAEEKPFNLTMMTADAHHIGGYICDLCDDEYEDVTANVISCADKQLQEFIEWCKEQEFFENTTIVLVGDHTRMDTHLVEGVSYNDRTLYNCFINAVVDEGVSTTNREASLLDMYPTVLSAMGYEIKGNKIGLGVNLFSEEPTLLERLGFDEVNAEFNKRSSYYVARFAPELSYLVEDEESAICTVYFGEEGYNASDYVTEGLSPVEGVYSWLSGKEMKVSIPIEEDVDKVSITIHILGTVRAENYYVAQGDERLCEGMIKKADVIRFDAKVINGTCDFSVHVPLVEPLYAYGMGEDTREISLKLTHMTVNLCESEEE